MCTCGLHTDYGVCMYGLEAWDRFKGCPRALALAGTLANIRFIWIESRSSVPQHTLHGVHGVQRITLQAHKKTAFDYGVYCATTRSFGNSWSDSSGILKQPVEFLTVSSMQPLSSLPRDVWRAIKNKSNQQVGRSLALSFLEAFSMPVTVKVTCT